MRRVVVVGAVLLTIGLTGCVQTGDVITFSRKSRAEGIKRFDAGDLDGASGAFRDATRQNSRDFVSFYYLGRIYQQQGNEQLAAQSYRTSLNVKSKSEEGRTTPELDAEITDAIAGFLATARSREIELAAWEEQAQRTQDPLAWLVVAKAYAAAGDADNALSAYARAEGLGASNLNVLKPYGLYLERLGQKPRAQGVLTRAYQLAPQDEDVVAALRRLGVVPGPSLLEQEQLVRPAVPRGPIPELNLGRGQER